MTKNIAINFKITLKYIVTTSKLSRELSGIVEDCTVDSGFYKSVIRVESILQIETNTDIAKATTDLSISELAFKAAERMADQSADIFRTNDIINLSHKFDEIISIETIDGYKIQKKPVSVIINLDDSES